MDDPAKESPGNEPVVRICPNSTRRTTPQNPDQTAGKVNAFRAGLRRIGVCCMAGGAIVLVGSILLAVVEIYLPGPIFLASGIVMITGFSLALILGELDARDEQEREPSPPPLRTTPEREPPRKRRRR